MGLKIKFHYLQLDISAKENVVRRSPNPKLNLCIFQVASPSFCSGKVM